MRRFFVPLVLAVFILGVAAPAGAIHLKLVPTSFGAMTTADWKAREGQPDSAGNANEALLLQKKSPTAANAFASAFIGAQAQPAAELEELSWHRRNDGRCGLTSPRWEIGLFVPSTNESELAVLPGCAFAVHSPGGAPGWTRDSYPAAVIDAAVAAETGGAPARVRFVQIMYDEGPDTAPFIPFVFLDNITLQTTTTVTWTYAGDNSSVR